MVKIRLRRMGSKGRPFYRVVVTPSTSGRNGRFVEAIGVYDPVAKPKVIKVDEEKALEWLMKGAQPTETAAYILNKSGVMDKYFAARPSAKKQYSYLDKTTRASSVQSVLDTPTAAPEPEPEPMPAAAAPVEEPVAEEAAPVVEEAPAAEAPAEAAAEEVAEVGAEPEGDA